MSHHGDIKPVIKRVRPYKTLLINLPPKSFGFWVLANTKVDACYDLEDDGKDKQFVEAIDVTDIKEEENKIRRRRSLVDDYDDLNVVDINDFSEIDQYLNEIENPALRKRIDNLNNKLRKVHAFLDNNNSETDHDLFEGAENFRRKRQIWGEDNSLENSLRKLKKHLLKTRHDKRRLLDYEFKKNGLVENLLRKIRGSETPKKSMKITKSKQNKKVKDVKQNVEEKRASSENLVPLVNKEKHSRNRRNAVFNEKQIKKLNLDESSENVIEDVKDNPKIWKMLSKIQKQLNDLQMETQDKRSSDYEDIKSKEAGQILVKTKMFDDGATINLSEHPNQGLIKSTFENVFSVLGELNTNLNRFWNALTLLE